MSWYVDIGYEFFSSPIWHVIKCFVLKQEVLFSQVLYSHDITEVLLKVALDTIKNVGLFLIDIGINCVAHCLLCYCFKFSKVIVLAVFNYLTITGFFS